MVKKLNTDVASDEGTTIGGVGSYIQRYKDMGSGRNNSTPFTPIGEDEEKAKKAMNLAKTFRLPEKYNEETEKDIFLHYYARYGSGDCEDFAEVSGEITERLNRIFETRLTSMEVLDKLEKNVSKQDMAKAGLFENSESTTEAKASGTSKPIEKREITQVSSQEEKSTVEINLLEGEYTFIKGLHPLSEEQYDLVQFVDPDKICFSSDGKSLYLSVKPNYIGCFEELFDFSPEETMMYEMFKVQLNNDEHKAKKLVLMSRKLNGMTKKKTKRKTKKKTTKKKKVVKKTHLKKNTE